MPIYLPLHPEANLTATEQQQLLAGIQATFGGEADEQDQVGEQTEGEHDNDD